MNYYKNLKYDGPSIYDQEHLVVNFMSPIFYIKFANDSCQNFELEENNEYYDGPPTFDDELPIINFVPLIADDEPEDILCQIFDPRDDLTTNFWSLDASYDEPSLDDDVGYISQNNFFL